MAFALAGQSVRISDLVDHLIAVRYLGSDQVIESKFGTVTAARARLVDLGEGINRGTTLIFQTVLSNEVKAQADTWVVGYLREEGHPKYEDGTLFTMDTDGLTEDQILEGFAKAGVDPDAKV